MKALLLVGALALLAGSASAGMNLVEIIYENAGSVEGCLAALATTNLDVGWQSDGTLEGTTVTVNGLTVDPLQPQCVVLPP